MLACGLIQISWRYHRYYCFAQFFLENFDVAEVRGLLSPTPGQAHSQGQLRLTAVH